MCRLAFIVVRHPVLQMLRRLDQGSLIWNSSGLWQYSIFVWETYEEQSLSDCTVYNKDQLLFALYIFFPYYFYIKMVNYNMGRYYAWENLSKLIKSTIRKRFHTPSYNFTYIPPKIHTNIHFIPFEEWKANKNYRRSQFKYALAGIAFVAYLTSKFIYQVLEDDDQGYFYHLRYPVVSQSIVWIHADLAELTNPFFDIMPRDRYQVTQIYPRLYELIFKPQKKIEEQDRKAIQLRQAMEEYDKKHK